MRILAFLLFLQPFYACQQGQEKLPVSEAIVGSLGNTYCQSSLAKAAPSASNVVFKSEDGGQTWQDISAGLPLGIGIGSVYSIGGEVFLSAESGLYHSTNPPAAQPWEKELFMEKRVADMYQGRTGLYVCSYENGLFKKITGTDVWIRIANNLEDKTVRTVLETSNGTIFVGCDSGIYKSADAGETWKLVFADGYVNSFLESGDVLICGNSKGLLRSSDGGEHWNWVLSEGCQVEKTALIGGRMVAITRGGGAWNEAANDPYGMAHRLRISDDGGKTWQCIDESLSSARLLYEMDMNLPVWNINDIKQVGDYLFCSLDTGIFRSSDLGKTWELVFPGKGKKLLQMAVSGKVIYAVSVVGC